MTHIAALGEERTVVSNAADFGRVAVMLGGTSAEREVSLNTGAAVLAALQSRGVDAHAWDPGEKPLATFATAGFVWIALHGTGGEDGALQGALQWFGIPYTGSGVMASALAMDKIRSKHLFEAAGIPTPEYAVIRHEADAVLAAEKLGFPMILKPSGQGSSVGMSKVFEQKDLAEAARLALEYSDVALAERCIVGDELTVAVLQGQALPTIRIETRHRVCSTTTGPSTNRIAPNTTARVPATPRPRHCTRALPRPHSRKLAVPVGGASIS